MSTKASKPVLITVPPISDGIYLGRWGGYKVRFDVGGSTFEATTEEGIRTPSAPCVVTVKDGKISVEAKQ